MVNKKQGQAIKAARTAAGLTQEQLARKIKGVSAVDISAVERGEKEFTQAILKEIAKATGVTQSSLINAGKTTTSTAKKTTTSTSTKKTTTSTAKKTTSSTTTGTSMKVTATEKKLVELYREADSSLKKEVMSMLKGEEKSTLEQILKMLGVNTSTSGSKSNDLDLEKLLKNLGK